MADSRREILKQSRFLLNLLLGLALAQVPAAPFFGPASTAVAADRPDCPRIYTAISEQSAAIADRAGKTRFPVNFSKADRRALINEFKRDGRPILVVTDGTFRQKSGVVTVMNVMKDEVEKLTDHRVSIHYLTPDDFPRVLDLKYQNLTIPIVSQKKFDKAFESLLKQQNPQVVHIMVEGALGAKARRYCLEHGIPFTTAYHSMFPEFVAASVGDAPKLIAVEATYQTGKVAASAAKPFGQGAAAATEKAFTKAEQYAEKLGQRISDTTRKLTRPLEEPVRKLVNAKLRKFHEPSEGILVPTESMAKNLIENGYDKSRIRYWSHGVDTELFRPDKADPKIFENLPKPISIFIGRVSAEKNIEDFLKMKIPGTKVIVGGGPELETLKVKYPDAVFLGRRNYEDLPKYYASVADQRLPPEQRGVFVFPSLTDTFGLVQLEANASGVPVVAYKVQGPVDVITSPKAGRLADYRPGEAEKEKNVERLTQAWYEAQKLDGKEARKFAEDHTWQQSTVEFLYFLKRLPAEH